MKLTNGKTTLGVVSVTVRLPVDLEARVASMCRATDCSVQGFYQDALRGHLARRRNEISKRQIRLYADLLTARRAR
jgi:hypothetical protein